MHNQESKKKLLKIQNQRKNLFIELLCSFCSLQCYPNFLLLFVCKCLFFFVVNPFPFNFYFYPGDGFFSFYATYAATSLNAFLIKMFREHFLSYAKSYASYNV